MRPLFLGVCGVLASVHWLCAQCPDGTPPPCSARSVRAAAPAAASVAVLSFDNRSRDTSDAFLADGLADEISTRLTQLGRLAVVSRAQVRRLRGAETMDMPAIGRALNTANLVTGTVQGTPTHLRVSVELLRAANATQLWSNVYDRGRSDLLEIQGDIATEVARLITGALRPGDRAALARAPTRNPEAYEHILRGDVFAANRNAQRIALAIREYEAAVALDPGSPRAQAGLAKGYALCRDYLCPLGVAPDTLAARAAQAAGAALRLDSGAADSWTAAAFAAYARRPVEGRAALRAARRAITLDSTSAESWHFFGWLSLLAGQDSSAELAYRRALRLDPGRAVTYAHLGRIAAIQRNIPRARAMLDSALAIEPSFGLASVERSFVEAYAGNVTAARSFALQAGPVYGDDRPELRVAAVTAYALIQAGDTARGRVLADSLAPFVTHQLTPAAPGLAVAFALVRLGRVDEALRISGINPGPSEPQPVADFFFQAWSRMPYWDAARGHPAFERLVGVNAAAWRER